MIGCFFPMLLYILRVFLNQRVLVIGSITRKTSYAHLLPLHNLTLSK